MNAKTTFKQRLTSSVGKKQLAAIAVLLALGGAAGVAILGSDPSKPAAAESEHNHEGGEHAENEQREANPTKGPNGGQLLADGDFGVEVLLAEQGGEPRMKLWLSQKGQPLPADGVRAAAELVRPGGDTDKLAFTVDKGGLISTQPVSEPHVFQGTITLQTATEPYIFSFSQKEGVIALSDAQVQSAGIGLDTAGPASIRSALQLPGEIRFNEDRTAHVVPRVAGIVEAVPVSLGQTVQKGQVLAVISSAQVSEQRSELQAAQKRLQLARTTYERERKLFEERISPEQDVLQAQQALREAEISVANAQQKLQAFGAGAGSGSLNRFELKAPFDGVVVEKHISLGEQVKEDANVFTLSDLRSVWAQMNVPAKDLPLVGVGERAIVRATSFEQAATGTVAYVGSLIGDQTRTAPARVTLANPNMAWRPGLFVNVELVASETSSPVTVSAEAIQTLNDKPVVFLRTPGGFVPQPVQVGRSDGKRVEIVNGLKPGARYASTGSFVLKAEAGKGSATHTH